MGRYRIIRTDTADAGLRKIILYVAVNFGNAVALVSYQITHMRELNPDILY